MNDKIRPLTPDPPGDDFNIRCPRLGHEIFFSYCRRENSGLPCFKTLDCWFNYFDVVTHMKNSMDADVFETVFQKQTRPKILSLFDLIQKAKD